MSLYPTKTRLALLQAVADGAISRHQLLRGGSAWDVWDDITRVPRRIRVTARCNEASSEGWIRLGPTDSLAWNAPRLWELTASGGSVLNGYGRVAATP